MPWIKYLIANLSTTPHWTLAQGKNNDGMYYVPTVTAMSMFLWRALPVWIVGEGFFYGFGEPKTLYFPFACLRIVIWLGLCYCLEQMTKC